MPKKIIYLNEPIAMKRVHNLVYHVSTAQLTIMNWIYYFLVH